MIPILKVWEEWKNGGGDGKQGTRTAHVKSTIIGCRWTRFFYIFIFVQSVRNDAVESSKGVPLSSRLLKLGTRIHSAVSSNSVGEFFPLQFSPLFTSCSPSLPFLLFLSFLHILSFSSFSIQPASKQATSLSSLTRPSSPPSSPPLPPFSLFFFVPLLHLSFKPILLSFLPSLLFLSFPPLSLSLSPSHPSLS